MDTPTFQASLKTLVDAEKAYVASLVEESGKIHGMGPKADATAEAQKAELKADLKARYMREGKTPEIAEQMAELVIRGR